MAGAQENPTHISLRVRSQDGKLKFFKIRRDTQLKKLLLDYCRRRLMEYESTVFLIEERQFNHKKTSDDLTLEENTEIQAIVHQGGG